MSILVVGSVALDTVETPFGKRERTLGGSATFFSFSASFFDRVNMVAVVGKDFPREHIELLKSRGIDTRGLRVLDGETFHWVGAYGYDMNTAITHSTCLNVFQNFKPEIPEEYKKSECVFLANIDPDLQMEVLGQIERPRLVACDTMNFWIDGKRDTLLKLLGMVDVAVLNEAEARQLTRQPNLVRAGRMIREWGPEWVVIKKGEHGALLFGDGHIFAAPAYPMENIIDPTGAGDTFAGGFMGHLSRAGNTEWNTMRQAVIYGSVMASFNVEDFSLDRMKTLTEKAIGERYREFMPLSHFE
ncbi:MAG: PfkB family carbohydrate kinase [Candidatus Aureabacteria bacterium]|nr:PfkB family carbohydrate kinase [Candidatus Auribacterota bacterium]